MTPLWQGHVYADGAPAPGVAVSDGRSVTLTSADGAYRLERQGAESATAPLLWIRVPAGFHPDGPWYKSASESDTDFHLSRDDQQHDAFSFVFLTDLHLPRSQDQPFAAVLDDIRRLSPRPAFWVNGGDVEVDNGMGPAAFEMLASLNLPGRHVMGNHDLCVGRADPYADFRSLFGPERCSWDYGRFHFVTLCGLVPNPTQTGWRNVEGELGEEELTWLEADLALAGGRPVIAFIHIPPFSTFPQRHGVRPRQEPAWEVRRADRLLDLCRRFNVRLVLSGHFHENERIMRDGTIFQTTGAVCGHWWERGGRPACNLDGTSKGYRIIYVDGDDCQSLYRGIGGTEQQIQILSPHAGQTLTGDITVEVSVIDGAAGDTRVECCLGYGDWMVMDHAPQSEGPNVLANAHRWAAHLPAPDHAGTHLLGVRAFLPTGVCATEQIAINATPPKGV